VTATERVEIDGIAAGGSGVGRLADGRAVFVPRTAPGDVATVRLTASYARWARAELTALEHAGPDRRDAPCPLYAECGGCALQHLQPEAQRTAKAGIVRQALRRIGGRDPGPVQVVPAPSELRYRNRMSFTLMRLAGGRVVAGLHAVGEPGRIIDVDGRCLLPEADLAAAWDALRASWGPRAEALPAGPRLRLTVRSTGDGRYALLVRGGTGRGRPEALLAGVPGLAAVWLARSDADRPRRVAGDGPFVDAWHDDDVEVTGNAFVQVNRAGAALLYAHVLDLVGAAAGLRVVDAYCGVGAWARRLARDGATAVGIERDADAVTAARRAAPPGATFVQGAVEQALAGVLPADLVIANPPRSGMHAAAVDALTARPPARIIYVSCDPATLARDLARLGDAFKLRAVRGFDLFPQTAHIETVVELACATS
jgi:23S rRNA (uracil1939-C5)-methyltransferase